MSFPTASLGQLRTWVEDEIEYREHLIRRISGGMKHALTQLNPAWRFFRIESPVLIPKNFIDSEYGDADIYQTDDEALGRTLCLAPETTAYSYIFAQQVLAAGQVKLPFCVWQARKSFRKENLDGANASKMRYKEFYQLEFQCLYSDTTKADIYNTVVSAMFQLVGSAYPLTMVEFSDRIPNYADVTQDILVGPKAMEVASLSMRHDFPNGKVNVVEAAFGLDRLVDLKSKDGLCGL